MNNRADGITSFASRKMIDAYLETVLSVNVYHEDTRSLSYTREEKSGEIADRTLVFETGGSPEQLDSQILMDPLCEQILNREAIRDILFYGIDFNALACVRHVAFVYDNGDDFSPAREVLYALYNDEYARYVGEDYLGAVWVDRSDIIINVGAILDTAWEEIAEWVTMCGCDPEREYEIQLRDGIIGTLLHEFRHAVFELNDLSEKLGYDPKDDTEQDVETYAREEYDANDYIRERMEDIVRPGTIGIAYPKEFPNRRPKPEPELER